LIRVALPDGRFVEYRYDPFGRRIEKNVNGVITRYVYDREDILFELDGNNNIITEYLHGPGVDEPIAMIRNNQTYYYHADDLGSIIAITNSAGQVVQRYEYNSFGEITYQQDPNFVQPYTYTGREYDQESGLYYYRARYYDAKVGRFISKDPFRGYLRRPQTQNRYIYVGNNPINYRDPLGLARTDSWDPRFYTDFWGNFFGGGYDFYQNYQDMRDANTVGADKYFHCKANCQASRRGFGGREAAESFSEGRELFDEYIKGDPRSVCDEDRAANKRGREGNPNEPCNKVCEPLRPAGLPSRY
jgi:RHS repeat-associated protein